MSQVANYVKRDYETKVDLRNLSIQYALSALDVGHLGAVAPDLVLSHAQAYYDYLETGTVRATNIMAPDGSYGGTEAE